jgi:cytochrome c-type biogenesis protein CcmE
MKKTHIVGIVLIAICLGVIVTMLSDASSYANFAMAYEHQDQQFHVVGKLNPDKPIDYDPTQNTELLSFYMIDELGVEKQVHLHAAKPQDFERADQIVLIGQVEKDGAFHANDILTKCPSKYDEENKVESEPTAAY